MAGFAQLNAVDYDEPPVFSPEAVSQRRDSGTSEKFRASGLAGHRKSWGGKTHAALLFEQLNKDGRRGSGASQPEVQRAKTALAHLPLNYDEILSTADKSDDEYDDVDVGNEVTRCHYC